MDVSLRHRHAAGRRSGARRKLDVTAVFDLVTDGPARDITRDKDTILADWAQPPRYHKKNDTVIH